VVGTLDEVESVPAAYNPHGLSIVTYNGTYTLIDRVSQVYTRYDCRTRKGRI
jgi:hypothetical protein